MNPEDDDFFAQAMREVQPMAKAKKVKKISKSSPKIISHLPKTQISPTTASLSNMLNPKLDEPWILRADGVSPDILKKLANGQPAISQEIDLHGMTRNNALKALEASIKLTLRSKQRVICAVHGRGLHSKEGKPVVKNSIYEWLAHGPMSGHILAVIPTPHTAGGSCLILLRRDKHK